MIKKALTIFAISMAASAHAQYFLSGTSYVQHFDSLSSGLPPGWQIDTAATAVYAGGSAHSSFIATPGTNTSWASAAAGFKNVASGSAFAFFKGTTATMQAKSSNRALGLKQTARFGDPGASFSFCIANTAGLSDFRLSLRLQSLDSSGGSRTNEWTIEYAIGAPDYFRPVATSDSLVTGGNSFSSQLVSATLDPELNNQPFPVWIRITTLKASTGSGSRTTVAIDDFTLSWTGTALPRSAPLLTRMEPASGMTLCPAGIAPSFHFNMPVKKGSSGNIYVRNATDLTTQTIAISDTDVVITDSTVLLQSADIQGGKEYHILFDSTCFRSDSLYSTGIYDTTAWWFHTAGSIATSLNERFDSACAASLPVPGGWTVHNINGRGQAWNCYAGSTGNSAYRINGFEKGNYYANDDWLITPLTDISSLSAPMLSFGMFRKFTGNNPEILLSSDYNGISAPATASWHTLPVVFKPGDTAAWKTYTVDLSGYATVPFHIAFRYTATSLAGYDVQLDSVRISGTSSANGPEVQEPDAWIAGIPSESSGIEVVMNSSTATHYFFRLFNTSGQCLYTESKQLPAGIGNCTIQGIALLPGLYLLEVSSPAYRQCFKIVIP